MGNPSSAHLLRAVFCGQRVKSAPWREPARPARSTRSSSAPSAASTASPRTSTRSPRSAADAVYLTPIFTAPSPHKYDTTDFDRVDPAFGGEAAFDRLVAACRARQLGLILDGVFNHVGAGHRWRARASRLVHAAATGAATRRCASSTRRSAEVRRACCDVVARWTARGATGWRLDCANDLGVPFAGELARAARDAGAVDGVIGEVMAYGAGWVRPNGLDGVMNYWLRAAALALASSSAPADQLQHALDRLAAEADARTLQRSWSLVGSHDTAAPGHRARR